MLTTILVVLVLLLVAFVGFIATRPAKFRIARSRSMAAPPESRAPESVTIRLEFIRPFAATNTAQFDFVPSGTGTNVTWAMTGENGFVAKAMSLFMNMDKLVGGDFEKGLRSLDEVSAKSAGSAR